MSASIRIGSSWSKDYGKDVCYLHCCSISSLRASHCPSEIQRGYSHLRRARAPEGTADVDGTGVGYGPRWSCGVGYAVRE